MYTEEDTFNCLRRLSFDGMLRIIVPHCKIGENVVDKAEKLGILRPNGWTKNDFKAEFKPENSDIIDNAYRNYR